MKKSEEEKGTIKERKNQNEEINTSHAVYDVSN